MTKTKDMEQYLHLFTKVEDGLPPFGKEVVCLFYPEHPTMDGKLHLGLTKRIDVTKVDKFVRKRINEHGFAGKMPVIYWLDLSKLTTKERAIERISMAMNIVIPPENKASFISNQMAQL